MNFFAVGFVGVLGLVGLGVDYHQQSVKADLPLGQMPLEQYIGTYEARFLGAKAEMRAQEREEQRQSDWRAGGIAFLPEAPEGWTRRAYSSAINTAIMPDTVTYYEEMGKNGTAVSLSEKFKAQNAWKKAMELDRTSWVYERGDEAVFISLRTKDEIKENSIGGMIGMKMGAMSSVGYRSVRGYRVVGGVGFVELPQKAGSGVMSAMLESESAAKERKGPRGFDRAHFRRLVGTVGFDQEVVVTVHANAPLESTLEVLNAVDWDGINSMLKTPMAVVGNDVVLPEDRDHAKITVEMMRQRNLFAGLRRMAADFKFASGNAAAMLFNMYGGNMDVSGGVMPDLAQLIDMGFRKEIRDLMAGRPSEGEYQRIRAMMVERPEDERDAPKGEMNEELREELTWGLASAGPVQNGGARDGAQAQARDHAMLGQPLTPAQSAAFATVKMPGELTQEQILYFKHTQKVAKEMGDGPAQQAARLMEMERGLPPGACLVRHDTGQVACNKNADAVRAQRGAMPTQVVPDYEQDAGAPDSGGSQVKVTRIATQRKKMINSGCGAGKFCKSDPSAD